ncbi:unnamed protein product [Caenorhabditis angaria]|uniref:Sulfotransferase domain-containing protein n=1 Tax=Caenorhabditis angaria TaxID=860376 RepID=A0A9P1IUJ5_9PELO|nr:unnamed protein product [Caenorhabditis angaria]
MVSFLKHLRIDHGDLPHCDRTPPMTPKTPMSPLASPFVLNATSFCFRKGPARSVVYQPNGHPKQVVIDGEIWPPIFKPKNVRTAKMMQINENDVVIATYPKCGTTWLQHITSQLIKGVDYKTGKGNELCLQSPMIERMGAQFANSIQGPRVLKTHFNHVNIPRITSIIIETSKSTTGNMELGMFLLIFLHLAQLAFGDYFDHLLSWISHIDDENVLFLKYEDMVEDLEGSILKIGQFLGGDAAMRVQNYNSLREIVENSTIDAMKKDQKRWFPENILHKAEFIRKGGSRDWKNHFTREQSDRIDSIFQQKFAGTVAENWWKYEMAWDDKVSSMDNLSMYSSGEGRELFQLPPLSQRRYSRASLLSSGYGSVWSLASVAAAKND